MTAFSIVVDYYLYGKVVKVTEGDHRQKASCCFLQFDFEPLFTNGSVVLRLDLEVGLRVVAHRA